MDSGKCEGGCNFGIRPTGRADTNPSELPHCDKALPRRAKPFSWIENLDVKVDHEGHENVHLLESGP